MVGWKVNFAHAGLYLSIICNKRVVISTGQGKPQRKDSAFLRWIRIRCLSRWSDPVQLRPEPQPWMHLISKLLANQSTFRENGEHWYRGIYFPKKKHITPPPLKFS